MYVEKLSKKYYQNINNGSFLNFLERVIQDGENFDGIKKVDGFSKSHQIKMIFAVSYRDIIF